VACTFHFSLALTVPFALHVCKSILAEPHAGVITPLPVSVVHAVFGGVAYTMSLKRNTLYEIALTIAIIAREIAIR